MQVHVGEGGEADGVGGAHTRAQGTHVAGGPHVAPAQALELPLGIHHEAVGAGTHRPRCHGRLGHRAATAHVLPGAHTQARGLQRAHGAVELAPVIRAVTGLDVHRADAVGPRAGDDGVQRPLGAIHVPDPHAGALHRLGQVVHRHRPRQWNARITRRAVRRKAPRLAQGQRDARAHALHHHGAAGLQYPGRSLAEHLHVGEARHAHVGHHPQHALHAGGPHAPAAVGGAARGRPCGHHQLPKGVVHGHRLHQRGGHGGCRRRGGGAGTPGGDLRGREARRGQSRTGGDGPDGQATARLRPPRSARSRRRAGDR